MQLSREPHSAPVGGVRVVDLELGLGQRVALLSVRKVTLSSRLRAAAELSEQFQTKRSPASRPRFHGAKAVR